jgi:hypothetical protein
MLEVYSHPALGGFIDQFTKQEGPPHAPYASYEPLWPTGPICRIVELYETSKAFEKRPSREASTGGMWFSNTP